MRKILWVSNSPIGPSSKILDQEYKGSSGGWIQSEYDKLNENDNKMYYLSTLPNVQAGTVIHKSNDKGEIFCVHQPKISYGIKVTGKIQNAIQKIIDEINPDIIHIWGTETWLSNAVSKCETKASKIIFVQGLIGVHQRYLGGYFGKSKDEKEFISNASIVSKIKGIVRKYYFSKQASIEKETILNCKNVIVDSDFSKAYCKSISNSVNCIQYTLLPNEVFYKHRWNKNSYENHTIFTVYGSSAEKGVQNLLKAIKILKDKYEYNDIKLFIPGNYILDSYGKITEYKKDIFQMALYRMIKKYELWDNVIFTGKLNVEEMADRIQKSHVFVNPSCMEVHALSLREALVVGTPCIGSLCGSTGEYINNGVNGYIYRYEEYESLAYFIDRIFSNNNLANELSIKGREIFENKSLEYKSLDYIYDEIQGEF